MGTKSTVGWGVETRNKGGKVSGKQKCKFVGPIQHGYCRRVDYRCLHPIPKYNVICMEQ